jgi:hypothetical protein
VYVLQASQSRDQVAPQAIIPFALTQEQAIARLRRWLRDEHLTQVRLRAPVGVYQPAWLFSGTAMREWQPPDPGWAPPQWPPAGFQPSAPPPPWPARSPFFFEDILVPAGRQPTTDVIAALQTFALNELQPFDPAFLADWPAESYALAPADASLRARAEVVRRARQADQTGLTQDEPMSGMVRIQVESARLVLLPLFLARYERKGIRYSVAVNGQSGAVRGEKPAGWLSRLLGSQKTPPAAGE